MLSALLVLLDARLVPEPLLSSGAKQVVKLLVGALLCRIAVPDQFVNLMPTDIRGQTFVRSPQQVIR